MNCEIILIFVYYEKNRKKLKSQGKNESKIYFFVNEFYKE